MTPHTRYYFESPAVNELLLETVKKPSRQEFDELRSYEPGKIGNDYEWWASQMVEREIQAREQRANATFVVKRACINNQADVARIENSPNFIRWNGEYK